MGLCVLILLAIVKLDIFGSLKKENVVKKKSKKRRLIKQSNIEYKKVEKLGFSQKCTDEDKCDETKGLSCINGTCMCEEDKFIHENLCSKYLQIKSD